jgi:hypothetical protein
MKNLLEETIAKLAENGLKPENVKFVSTVKTTGTWDEFAALADFKYDNGYGGANVNTYLKVVGDDWWLERGEYDGAEWWEFKKLPVMPTEPQPLTKQAITSQDRSEEW